MLFPLEQGDNKMANHNFKWFIQSKQLNVKKVPFYPALWGF